jgi:hypothetical protein
MDTLKKKAFQIMKSLFYFVSSLSAGLTVFSSVFEFFDSS